MKSLEHYIEVSKKLRKSPEKAKGLCCSCVFWQVCPTQTPFNDDTPEMICGKSKAMCLGLHGQDGKCIITPADFGCIHYQPNAS